MQEFLITLAVITLSETMQKRTYQSLFLLVIWDPFNELVWFRQF